MSAPLRRLATLTTVGGLLAAGVAVSAAPASAAPAFTATSGTVIVGDVTGDGVRDRSVLGRLGETSTCAVQITRGLAGGGWGATSTVRLPVRGDRSPGAPFGCADLGVVLRGPTPGANRLAVGFFNGPGTADTYVQIFSLTSGAGVYRTGFDAQYQPSVLGSQDFDGDGWGDLWERTDQGDGFDAYLVRPASATSLYSSEDTAVASAQFVDLDQGPGVDILLTTDAYPSFNAGAVAVEGATGATKVLASSHDGTVSNYTVTTTDLDQDAYPDLRVESVPDPGSGAAPVVKSFLNRTQNGRFAFQLVPSDGAGG